jgi:predicted kinase
MTTRRASDDRVRTAPMIAPLPSPPDFRVDWPALDASYPWVRALAGCEQDPVHHAEGDVWIHTRMVVEALAALDGFRALDEDTRAIVFAAAILHDVAKPLCTRREADGRIHARGHSARGANLARQILWRAGASFAAREAVCAMVLHHQVPFFLIEREQPRRLAIEVSWRARADLLSLVTEADGRGRHCHDQQRLLDHIDLFRAFCAEEGCLSAPRPFASDHARFHYLVQGGVDPDYRPHEAFRAEVVLLSGLPGAGKDTWVERNLPDWPVVSLDRLRVEHDVDPADAQGPIVAAAREAAREHLRQGRSFVWNATTLNRQFRAPLIKLFTDYGARVRIVYVEAPPDRLLEQNRARKAVVPHKVLARMLDRWEVPDRTEAHAVDYIVAQ